MNNEVKALLAKKWKNESADLEPGRHFVDEEIVVRVHGSVEKRADQLVSPTVSIPLIPTLALFWEKAGITRAHALKMLCEAITEAMADGVNEDANIQDRIGDVTTAITAVRKELIDQLPKMKRAGRLDLSDLEVEVVPTVAVPNELLSPD
jgi:methionine aminopeptidase